MNFNRLAIANLRHKPARTIGLGVLVALLAFAVLAGVLVSQSLQNGLASLEARLGADVLVAPQTAKSETDLQSVLIDGTPGYFYMDKSNLERVAELEGVEKVSPQYYLATVKAGCCSMPVQIIGFDPETDFTIQPWIARSYTDELGREDIVTGANITGTAGSTVLFYGKECRIVARLDETGTELDNAVFATNDTLKDLIEGSQEQGISVLADNDPEDVISTILVKVKDGYDPSDLADSINLHLRGLTAVSSKAMTSGVSDGVAGTSAIVSALMAVIALIALVVLIVAFAVVGKQRTREFAVLRVLGASRSMLVKLVMTESLVIGVIGALVGCALACVALFGLNGVIEDMLGLPFLMPDAGFAAAMVAAVFIVAALAGSLACALSAMRLSRVEAGQIMRED